MPFWCHLGQLDGPADKHEERGCGITLDEEGSGRVNLPRPGGAAYFAALWLLGFRLEDFSRRDRIAAPAPAADPDVDD